MADEESEFNVERRKIVNLRNSILRDARREKIEK
jgi:hypothetical protein